MTRTGQAAIDNAHSRVGSEMPAAGYCLQFVRQVFDVGSLYGSAIDAWNNARVKHPGDRNPPASVPVYFRTPSVYDHVAFACAPGGSDITTTFNEDIRHYAGDAISKIERDFNGSYLGWAEDINGVTIYTGGGQPPQPQPPTSEDNEMLVLQAPNRGIAVVMGHRVIPIGETNTADALTNVGIPRTSISDADFDRLLQSGNDVMLIREASRGFALLSGAHAIGIGDMATVSALQGTGHATVDVPAADFDRLTGAIANVIPDPSPSVSGRNLPALLALVVALAILVGLIVVLVAGSAHSGAYAGGGTLLGGLLALIASAWRARQDDSA